MLQLALPEWFHENSKLHVTFYLVHPHGEGVPVCDQEPLPDVKLGLVNQ